MDSVDFIQCVKPLGNDVRIVNNNTTVRQSSFKVATSATKVKSRKKVQFQFCESSSSSSSLPSVAGSTVYSLENDNERILDSLFWTQEELIKCRNDGILEIAALRSSYSDALHNAYLRALLHTTDLSITFQEYSMARGLEMTVFPAAESLTFRHRTAVLYCQQLLRQNDDSQSSNSNSNSNSSNSANPSEEVIRITSQRYSQASSSLARQLAMSDSME